MDQGDGVAHSLAQIDTQDAHEVIRGFEHDLFALVLDTTVHGSVVAGVRDQGAEHARIGSVRSDDHDAHALVLGFEHAKRDAFPIRGITEADQGHGVRGADQSGDVRGRFLPGDRALCAHGDDPWGERGAMWPLAQLGFGLVFGLCCRGGYLSHTDVSVAHGEQVSFVHPLGFSKGKCSGVRPLFPLDTMRILRFCGVFVNVDTLGLEENPWKH